ncbi:MAG: methyltransferase [Candidatus Aminicenantes bacterium]|nr:methyltransferase [Candidatus Aminicenantes bacterium]
MDSRTCILEAFSFKESSRIPVDLSGHRSSGISAVAYHKLRKYLGLPQHPVRIYDVVQQLAVIDEDVLDFFGVDTIELGRGFSLEKKDWMEWVLPEGTACLIPSWVKPERKGRSWIIRSETGREISVMPEGALYFEQTYFPFFERDDLQSLPDVLNDIMWNAVGCPPGPCVSGPSGKESLIRGARQLRERTERAVLGLFGGSLMESGQFLYRNDRFLALLAEEPKKAHAFLDKMLEIHMAALNEFIDATSPYIDIIVFGDDLGMQSGPLISPVMYREFFKPRHARMWRLVKERSPGIKVMLHCCGGVREFLPDLIDAGLDAINPVQISCRGMEASGLKKDFGKDIVFWGGGCDTQYILPNGSPDEVSRHVKEQVRILRQGGGFVFQQVHNILAGVPSRNIETMFRTVRECGEKGEPL